MSGILHIDLSNEIYCWAVNGKELYANSLENVKRLLIQDKITHVQLFGHDTKPELFKSVIQIICSSKFIKIVDIGGNRLQENAFEILKLLTESSSIQEINVANNWLENYGHDVASILIKSSFHTVDLSSNNFGDKEIEKIQSYLKENLKTHQHKGSTRILEEIIFSDNDIYNPYIDDVNETGNDLSIS